MYTKLFINVCKNTQNTFHAATQERGHLVSTENVAATSVRSLATVGFLPTDFDVPSEPIPTGRLNNSEFLKHVDEQSSYLCHSPGGCGVIGWFSFESI